MARRLCDQLGIWDELSAKEIVDADPYVKENDELRYKNYLIKLNGLKFKILFEFSCFK